MRKLCVAVVLVAVLQSMAAFRADACTNIIVTKGASVDGSGMVSYAADSHWLFGSLAYKPQGDWKAGDKLKIYDWDTWKYLGEIDQVAHTYKTVGNMNEHQLIIGETTYGGRLELMDPEGKIDYGSLIYVTLQRARTAREAISIMTALANEYGYCSEGETFSLVDKEEAWIMEMIGKGSSKDNAANKGVVWVARRIPDGYICSHANQARITTFPQYDPDNCMFSEDVISFARSKGYFSGLDEEFSFRDTYCPLEFGGLRGCEARAWSAFNILSDGVFCFEDENGNMVTRQAGDYLDYAMGYNKDNNMPLWIKPVRKISVKNVADAMRDHYEGTPMDMTQDIGAGGNALPYRWRPMDFKYEGKTYTNERAIATQQTGFWFVGQSRGSLPDVIGGILWFGTDDAATSYLTPIYTNVEAIPECFADGNGNLLEYSDKASFWINNRISNACYKMYNYMAPFVRERIDAFENEQVERIKSVDEGAMDLYNAAVGKATRKGQKNDASYDPMEDTGASFKKVKAFLTDYSVTTAQSIFTEWVELEKTLLVKFIDGNVKAQNPDGSFKHTDDYVGMPDGLTQPGYTDFWKKAVVEAHGDVIEEK